MPKGTTKLTDLYREGLALHWLKEKSKVPVHSGWTTGPKKSMDTLKSEHRKGFNVGARLGEASKLKGGGYLAVIDCDMKSPDKKHLTEMQTKLRELKLRRDAPTVLSGRGMGSRHIYIRTEKPQESFRFSQSKEKVKVMMPGSKPSKHESKVLGPEELSKGIRLRAAWEISIMGEGTQVALPPSVHPDTGKKYKWAGEGFRLPPKKDLSSYMKTSINKKVDREKTKLRDFEVVEVDLEKTRLSEDEKNLITLGDGSVDRSTELLHLSRSMYSIGMSENQILSVLTDRSYFIGEAAFDHAKTEDRWRAAAWVKRYSLEKAKLEVDDLLSHFQVVDPLNPPTVSRLEGESEIKAQAESLGLGESVFHEGGGWEKLLDRTGKDDKSPPKNTMKNIVNILKGAMGGGDFVARDLFKYKDYWLEDTPWGSKKGREVSDQDVVNIRVYLSFKYRMEPAKEKINDALECLIARNAYHPVQDYIRDLEWDGVKRLDTWLRDYLGARGPKKYLRAVGRKTLVAMIARAVEPGVKFDQMLILEGKQGVGKSTAARILAGDDWFSDAELNLGDKDVVMNMQGAWVYEVGELSVMRRYHVNQLKEFISRHEDRIRPPFGKRSIDFPRQSIFIGTTNNDEYLKDKTGNRRFWPVKVGTVDMGKLREDRDQLLAEAKLEYMIGESLFLDDLDVQKLAENEQGLRIESDANEELFLTYFEELKNMKKDEVPHFISLTYHHGIPPKNREKSGKKHLLKVRMIDLLGEISALSQHKAARATQMRAADCLKSLGFSKSTTSFGGINGKFWEGLI